MPAYTATFTLTEQPSLNTGVSNLTGTTGVGLSLYFFFLYI